MPGSQIERSLPAATWVGAFVDGSASVRIERSLRLVRPRYSGLIVTLRDGHLLALADLVAADPDVDQRRRPADRAGEDSAGGRAAMAGAQHVRRVDQGSGAAEGAEGDLGDRGELVRPGVGAARRRRSMAKRPRMRARPRSRGRRRTCAALDDPPEFWFSARAQPPWRRLSYLENAQRMPNLSQRGDARRRGGRRVVVDVAGSTPWRAPRPARGRSAASSRGTSAGTSCARPGASSWRAAAPPG